MSTLLVAVNPKADSLTVHVARRLEEALGSSGVEVADLAAEGFDPRFTLADRHVYHEGTDHPDDVRQEHRRLERASELVLVFPVYWWSAPALLKGWFDRVFVNGWAFDYAPETGIVRRLQGLRVHLIPVAADDASLYERHGYESALRTQIEHGIVDFCGAQRGVTAFLYESEQDDDVARQRSIDRVVTAVSEAITGVTITAGSEPADGMAGASAGVAAPGDVSA
ncbi:NAD(P)H-dependent oxidoreductase [Microbacterium sp.]|uniref:NAD(P)H-dependent oxidoreductase n=1 Tax=Microbacterium sp. TaxID=51671 RepID=UPI002629D837|nr:NAD(P)H-dependent oxidoreductase [Microbacterium sp.]